MKIKYSKRFERQLKRLRRLSQFEKVINLFKENQNHPSLHFKKINCKNYKETYSIRIDKNYRILMQTEKEIFIFICICNHDEYDRLIKDC